MIAEWGPMLTGWQYDLYEDILSSIDVGPAAPPVGPADHDARRLAAGAPGSRSGEQARSVRIHVDPPGPGRQRPGRARSFPTAADESYDSRELDPAAVRTMIARVAAHGDLAKRFDALRAADVRSRLGIEQPGSYDLKSATPPQTPITLARARAILHAAFAGLGAWYQKPFDDLLDPANGRADIVSSVIANRAGGGFSQGFIGTTGVLFVGRFDGTFKGLSVIAHEGGHAVHRQLMTDAGVSPRSASGPNWLFESFAEFNELVLADYMARQATDPATRRAFDEQFLGIKGLDWLYGAQDAALEQAIYDRVKDGTIRDADDLDAITLATLASFTDYAAKEPAQRDRWITTSLMFEDPNYDVNYLYASLLALQYFSRFKADPRRSCSGTGGWSKAGSATLPPICSRTRSGST